MKRRAFVTSVLASGLAVPAFGREDHDSHRPVDGPMANATVSFGAWPTDPPLDRTVPPVGPPPNVHQLLPYATTIKQGGSVNFVVAGFHQIAVYGPGVKPEDINASIVVPAPGAPPTLPPFIADPANRIYRGPFPLTLPQDRTEVVHFGKRGIYLVICSFVPHFDDQMWGWVRVIR
jgi:hypothetical protein